MVRADSSAISGDGTGPGGGELELDALIEALSERSVTRIAVFFSRWSVRRCCNCPAWSRADRSVGRTTSTASCVCSTSTRFGAACLRADAEGGGLTPLEQRMLTEEIDRRIAGFREALLG